MINLFFNRDPNSVLRILCLGAHSDDIEIGCGGTLLRLIDHHPNLSVCWVVFGSSQLRTDEAVQSAHQLLEPVAEKTVIVKGFRDSYFPYIGSEIKESFETIKNDFTPDVIFTHCREDRHQDHRQISDLTWNTFRDHFILEYEIPKYDGDLGTPNFFCHLGEQTCKKKIQHILSSFKTQSDRFWFTEDTFMALMRLRGVESRSPLGYAEAFYCRKLVLEPVANLA